MDKFGLPEKTLIQITEYFNSQINITEVRIFGSRAKNTYKPTSDIDLVIYDGIDEKTIRHISSELDELPTPYKFDIVAYNLLNDKLKNDIDNFSKPFYTAI